MAKAAAVVPFPNEAAVERAGQIESAMNEMRAIIGCLHATVEGERNLCARDFLVRQLESHHAALDELLFPG